MNNSNDFYSETYELLLRKINQKNGSIYISKLKTQCCLDINFLIFSSISFEGEQIFLLKMTS